MHVYFENEFLFRKYTCYQLKLTIDRWFLAMALRDLGHVKCHPAFLMSGLLVYFTVLMVHFFLGKFL